MDTLKAFIGELIDLNVIYYGESLTLNESDSNYMIVLRMQSVFAKDMLQLVQSPYLFSASAEDNNIRFNFFIEK